MKKGGNEFAGLHHKKPSSELIVWIDNKLVSSGDVRGAAHFRHDRLEWPDMCVFYHATAKDTDRAQYALDHDMLAVCYFALCVMQSQARRNAGASGRTIHFAIGKDTNVAACINNTPRSAPGVTGGVRMHPYML